MSRGLHLTPLDLDSQIQLLSRLQFLTRFSSNLIQITGTEGAGKTWLSQRYLELWAGDSRQSLLLCHPNQQDGQHRSIILQQLAPRAVFNEQDPLGQSLERLFEQQPVNALIVVDDAHLLSPELLAELWGVVQQARLYPDWQVNVLLFSHSGRLDKYLGQLVQGQGNAPLEVEISPLSEQEAQLMVEMMFDGEHLDAQGRRRIREHALSCAPAPGELLKLELAEDKDMAEHKSRVLSPVALLSGLVVVAVAVIAWWFVPVGEDKPLAISGIPQAQLDKLPEEPVGITTTKHDETGDKGQEPTLVFDDDSETLPPEVSVEGLTVGRRDTNPRVVVPSDVVDAMLNEQKLGGTGERAVEEGKQSLQPILPEGKPVQLPETELPDSAAQMESQGEAISDDSVEGDAAEEDASTIATQAATAEPTVEELGSKLRGVAPAHYALQLAAMRSLPTAEQFIVDYDIAALAEVYETRRNGVAWFIIVTGDYPDVQAARIAETRLPPQLQSVEPWVKSYRQIHTEMDRAK
ncbi:AAA family ATPase [Photobacterium sp. ZSDE20]|uniref:AAA family ATPase n=1 Tax=Photobacterium pectinilyticum TaxID=2906793 RepID=A0ABT1N0K6_9GAMM|nr:AAA family ATPase [Photobacterium sp. ZSDE20]MCQ1056799.1 AAA family ATPase [Photobacterium sp. ZSDE20]MDD1820814.1 AAA family ATPase [Photobacterium sp. ZSDE20]